MLKILFFGLSLFVPFCVAFFFIAVVFVKVVKKQIIVRDISRRLFYIALIWGGLWVVVFMVHTELWFQYIKYVQYIKAVDPLAPEPSVPISHITIEVFSVFLFFFAGKALLKWVSKPKAS